MIRNNTPSINQIEISMDNNFGELNNYGLMKLYHWLLHDDCTISNLLKLKNS